MANIEIGGRLHSTATGNVVTGANEVLDDTKNKKQSVINAEVDETIGDDNTAGTIKGRIKTAEGKLDTLNGGSSTSGSVAKAVADAKTELIGGATSNGNTLKKVEDRTATLETAVGSNGSVDQRIAAAKSEVIGDAASDYNTLGKLEDKIQAEATRAEAAEGALDSRVDTLEDAVGSGGSVDSRIAAAKAEIKGNATSACDTLGEAEALISAETNARQSAISNVIGGAASDYNTLGKLEDKIQAEATRAEAAESALQNNIEALTQSNIVVVADHTSVSSPDPLTIYREQGTNTYSDWMYQNGSWNKMATYNNAIDDVPTAESENLVKSNGVVSFIEGLDGFNSTSSFLRQADGASIAFKPKFWFNNTSRVRVDIKFKLHDVSETKFILSWLSNNVSCYIYSNSNNCFFISGLSSQTQSFLNTFTEGENIILSIERAASGDLVLYVNGILTNGVGFNSSTLSQSIPTIYVCGYYNDTASNYITDISYIKITNKETGEVQMVNACSKFEEFTAEAHLGFKSMISDIANGEFTLDRTITLAENTHLRGNNCIVHVQNGGQLVLGNGCSVDGFTFVGDWTYNRQAGEGEHRYDLVPLISASSSEHSEVDNAQTYVGTPVIKILGQNATVKNCRFKDIGRLCIEYNDNYMAYTVYTQPCIIDNHFFNCKGAISYLGEFGRISNNTIHSCVYGILLYAGNLNMSSCNFIRNDIAMLISEGHGNEGHSQFVGIECVHSGIAGIYVNTLARNLGDVFSGCQFADAPIIGHHCNSLVITGSILDTWFELTSGEGNMVACSVINDTTATRDNKPIFYDGATISLKHNIPMNDSISLDSINNTYYR